MSKHNEHHPDNNSINGGEPEANDLQAANFKEEDGDWGVDSPVEQSTVDSESLREQHQDNLSRDKVTRHAQGTEQVEAVINRTKSASKWLLTLCILGAITIFLIGLLSLPQIRELINLIPCLNLSTKILANIHWSTYLLLFLPTTLMAVLSITLWVTGLRFSAQIYGGITNEKDSNNDNIGECLKTIQEAIKQTGTGS